MDIDGQNGQRPDDAEGRSVRPKGGRESILQLRTLTAAQAGAIDRAVQEIGDYGEVRLIISKGHVRFIGKFKTESIPDN